MGCGCGQRTAQSNPAPPPSRAPQPGDWETLDANGDRYQYYKGSQAQRLAHRDALMIGGTHRRIPDTS